MQFPAETWRQLTGSQIRFCEELSFIGKGAWAYVGRAYFARKLGLSIWQVSRITSRLVDLGVIEKFQRRYRRRNGTWDSRPCLYRLAGWASWKFRSLFKQATGVRRGARIAEREEKITPPDLSFLKGQTLRSALQRFLALGGRRQE